MSLRVPRQRRSRISGPEPLSVLVNPTTETQATYNQIRDEQVQHHQQHCLQQHVTSEGLLNPSGSRAPRMARSLTNGSHMSGSLSPGSTTDIPDHTPTTLTDVSLACGKRPRGRRAGPLGVEKRFKTAIKRKLGFVCDHCKQKKVVCDHYDLSKFEEAYQETRTKAQADPVEFDSEPADFFGLGNSNSISTELPADEDITGDLHAMLPQPNSRQQHLHNLVINFDVGSVSLGNGTLPTSFGQPYNPGLASAQSSQTLSEPFHIGNEMSSDPDMWKCEHRCSASGYIQDDDCSWTGPLPDLKHHFYSEHRAFKEEEFWCHCLACSHCILGWEPPRVCPEPNCYGGPLRRSIYGHPLVETPALTQSGDSESGFSFDARASIDQLPFELSTWPLPR